MSPLEIGLLQPFGSPILATAHEAKGVLNRRPEHAFFDPIRAGPTEAGKDAGAQLRHKYEIVEMAGLKGRVLTVVGEA